MFIKCILMCCVLAYATLITAKEIDIDKFTTNLTAEDITSRAPPSRFKFIKDRTPSSITKRIINGNVAIPHQYPYQVALYVSVYVTLYFCGGSLIRPEWILTAAHCVDSSTSVIVVLGSHNLNQTETSRVAYNCTTYVVHEDWDVATLQNDVALIKLPRSANLSSYIGIVPLPSGSNSYTGFKSRCLGWGRTLLGSISNVLRYVDAEVISNKVCRTYEDYEPYIVDHHLCTSGEGFVGSCNGDSGGPLIINGTQVGIVSFGYSDCAAGYPSVYTRLTEFTAWINESIENYGSDSSGDVSKIGCLLSIFPGIFSIMIIRYLF